jgi:hypothetical protein
MSAKSKTNVLIAPVAKLTTVLLCCFRNWQAWTSPSNRCQTIMY